VEEELEQEGDEERIIYMMDYATTVLDCLQFLSIMRDTKRAVGAAAVTVRGRRKNFNLEKKLLITLDTLMTGIVGITYCL
jgi:hypothetical protein